MTVTGGLDLWPADPAIPKADYTDSLTAEDVPFELLDARRGHAPLAAVAARRRRRPRCGRRRAAWPTRSRAMPRIGGSPGRTARRCATGRPVTAIRDAGGGDLEVVTGGATYRTGRVVIAADAWTNELLASFGRRLPLTVTKEQVTYFACPDPAAFAPDRFPVWIWMDDPSFYGFPTYGEAGPKAAQDCGGQPVDPDRADVRARRGRRSRASRAFLDAPSAGRARPADLHQDLPLHADPGSRLRGRSAARGSRASSSSSAPPTASSSPRSSAGSRPS